MRSATSVLLVLVYGCTAGSPSPIPDESGISGEERSGELVPVSCEGLETSLIAAMPTRAGLRASFGAADSIRIATEPNRHMPDVVDSLFVVHYPGLVATLRKPGGGDDMPDLIEIADARYVGPAQLAPGVSAAQVVAVLGEPTEQDDTRLVYDCNLGADQPVTFHVRGGRVASITIDYYLD